ncbi:hypothetical protein Acr_07g0004300 [Actinidia rufa]|uniref:Ubiquitin-conjugating enzyme E2-binding protein n=1 Tax=Actinidia rufa TaxID=165716 RepID=A0A7J0EUZ8_9ERIC|nr:hypothetical protein Acr_07g0004300 [Actinidia rufa]
MACEPGASENPRKWRFTWEAQSHIPTLKLLIFDPNTKPPIHCQNLKVQLVLEQSVVAVTWLEDEAVVSLRVPIPRALLDEESPVQFRALNDHVEAKLVLLLPVDHPILASFDSDFPESKSRLENAYSDDSRPLLMDSDIKSLSATGEVKFYCRSCSTQLTRALRLFSEMPSTNWHEVADNWFGACCCSFGGVSEKMVKKYASSYTSAEGMCLLSNTFVLLCKDDFLGCKFPCRDGSQKHVSESDFIADNGLTKAMPNRRSNHGSVTCCDEHTNSMLHFDGNVSCSSPKEDNLAANLECQVSGKVIDAESLSCMFYALEFSEDVSVLGCCSDRSSHELTHKLEDCSFETSGTSPKEQKLSTTSELLENQKSFLNGLLGDVFMTRSSNLSKDIQWVEFLCPQCSCLLGAYPSSNDHAPLDGGVRLFKCYISTCRPVRGSNDLFRKYTLKRMFTTQLLENAKDELSFRTVVRDLQTKSAMLQIILLNPNSWCCNGYCLGIDNATESAAKVDLFPAIKVLFSDCSSSTKSQSRMIEEWVTKNQADEVYMLAHQINALIKCLELAKDIFPLSYASLQGMEKEASVPILDCYLLHQFLMGKVPVKSFKLFCPCELCDR